MSLQLNLLVIYAKDVARSKAFYEILGATFQNERHGSGAAHFAAHLDGTVFEIYPRNEPSADVPAARFGFRIASVDETVVRLERIGAQVLTMPQDSPWGRRAVLRDLDGYVVEISSAH